MNIVCLIGRVSEPETRTTTTGKAVASFRIAVGRGDQVQWFSVVAWNKDADYVANYITKGRLVSVEGRLQSRKYTASDGSNREVVEVVANNVQGLDRPRDDDPKGSAPTAGAKANVSATATRATTEDDYDPFAE